MESMESQGVRLERTEVFGARFAAALADAREAVRSFVGGLLRGAADRTAAGAGPEGSDEDDAYGEMCSVFDRAPVSPVPPGRD